MKKPVFIIAILILGTVCLAEELKLKDVPENHWAASAVYDLIRLGVTKGYPDGTFRGNKPITRYETAIFLSKLQKAIAGEDLRSEIKELRDQILSLKERPSLKVFGNYQGSWKLGNLLVGDDASRGGVSSYRLVLSASREISENGSFRISLDTLDYGFFDDGTLGRSPSVAELLAIESKLKFHPIDLKLTYGPGPKQHQADPTGILSSEVGSVYPRPSPGILASAKLGEADFSLGYFALLGNSFSPSGKIDIGQLTGNIAFNFLNNLRMVLTGDYISSGLFSTSDRDLRAKIDLSFPLGEKVGVSGGVGLGGTRPSEMAVEGNLSLNDPLETGTVIIIRAAKIGSEFINPRFPQEQIYFGGYDNFNRVREPGTVNLGGEFVQNLSDRMKLVGKGDVHLAGNYQYVGSKARLTAQGGISYNIAPNVDLDTAYRLYHEKATGSRSDVATFGLLYRF